MRNKKQRSDGLVAFSISMQGTLRADIDARADELGLSRSKYLSILARRDIASGGNVILKANPLTGLSQQPKHKGKT